MKKLIIFTLVILAALPSFAQKETPEAVVNKFFEALSKLDEGALRATSTTDFLLLEDGEVWTIDTLVAKINAMKGREVKRVNELKFVKTEVNGNTAWVAYHNTAVFKMGERSRKVEWLESAVLQKKGNSWQIRMLHSTVVKKSQ